MSRFQGSRIPDPGFGDDDGSAPEDVAAVMSAYAAGGADRAEVLAVLLASRLLVPVVAVPGEVEVDRDGLVHDKTSDMATVLVARSDGRRGMLAFTGSDSLADWDPGARPVPVTAVTAARAALQEGADALVVDIGGPVRFVLEGDDLRGAAEGWQPTRVGGRSAWIRPTPE